MKMNYLFLKRFFGPVVCGLMIFSCFGCAGKGSSAVNIAEGTQPICISSDNADVHYCSSTYGKKIAASGLITLFFDETSSAISVRINSGADDSSVWSALPVADSAVVSDEGNIVSLDIVHNGELYRLNSQDNSVAVNCAYWESIENGFRVIYFITDSPEKISGIGVGAANEAYSSAADGNILYKVETVYTLKDGCLYADLNWVNLGNKSDVLADIRFLEYFGASVSSVSGDFILVPDGSGALIDISSPAESEPLNIPVYGRDLVSENEMSAVIPAYGMKKGNSAFVAVIEHGDAVATINAYKMNNSSDYNHVGASYTVTPAQNNDGKVCYSDISYTDEIGLSFRFLNGSDASYAGLAAACREQMVRNYTLSTGSVENTEYAPILVNVIGSADKGEFFSFPKKLTTFDEAQDLLNRIKSKGINNVYLRYSGAMSGGLDSKNIKRATTLSSLGGNSALKSLDSYAATLNFSVFIDIALNTDSAAGRITTGDLVSSKSSFATANILNANGFTDNVSLRYPVRSDCYEDNVLSALEKLDDLNSTGFCLSDSGRFLYTDFVSGVNRQSVRNILSEKIQPLATQNLVMVEYGNFYSLKNADVVSGIPITSSRAEDSGYTAIPFVQIVLHGIVEYSGMPINTAGDKTTAFLKCIEYGMLPSYVLTDRSFTDGEKYSEIFSGDKWLNTMYNNYSSFTSLMGDLRSSRITNHYMVSSGVYCTEFESTTRIYVNYTSEPITVSGITVEPMNYFRVN